MSETAFTVFAADIAPDGEATGIDGADPAPVAPPGAALRWLHLDAGAPGFQDWADRRLPRIAAATLGQAETRPRCTIFEEGMAVNLRGVNLNPEGRTEDMVSLRVWVGERLVVTARLRRLMTMDAIRDDCRAGRGPTSPGAFLARVAKGLTDRAEEAMADLEERTDAMEDQSLVEGQEVDFKEIVALQRAVIMIRRFSAPQREAISRLASLGQDAQSAGIESFAAEDHVRLSETANRAIRLVETLETLRERLMVIQTHVDARAAQRRERQGYVLSVAAAIFLPLGFLTGLFGVNVGGMPGTSSPAAFAILSLAMVLVGAGLVWFFRSRDWL